MRGRSSREHHGSGRKKKFVMRTASFKTSDFSHRPLHQRPSAPARPRWTVQCRWAESSDVITTKRDGPWYISCVSASSEVKLDSGEVDMVVRNKESDAWVRVAGTGPPRGGRSVAVLRGGRRFARPGLFSVFQPRPNSSLHHDEQQNQSLHAQKDLNPA